MARPYGKTPKKKRQSSATSKSDSTAFKIKLRGKDNAPLTMQEMQQGLYEIARKLKPFENYRAKWVTLYMTAVDEDGNEVLIDRKGEWVLYPYKAAADEFGA